MRQYAREVMFYDLVDVYSSASSGRQHMVNISPAVDRPVAISKQLLTVIRLCSYLVSCICGSSSNVYIYCASAQSQTSFVQSLSQHHYRM